MPVYIYTLYIQTASLAGPIDSSTANERHEVPWIKLVNVMHLSPLPVFQLFCLSVIYATRISGYVGILRTWCVLAYLGFDFIEGQPDLDAFTGLPT